MTGADHISKMLRDRAVRCPQHAVINARYRTDCTACYRQASSAVFTLHAAALLQRRSERQYPKS
jgi:hypothetical protein